MFGAFFVILKQIFHIQKKLFVFRENVDIQRKPQI